MDITASRQQRPLYVILFRIYIMLLFLLFCLPSLIAGKAGDRSSAVRGKWQTLMEVGDQSWKETAKVGLCVSVCFFIP